MSEWPRLAELPLVIDSYELEGLTAELAGGMVRLTIQIRLLGAGLGGREVERGRLERPVAVKPGQPEATGFRRAR